MKVAVFLVGLLREYFERDAKDADRIAKRWKDEYDEFEATLPEPAERTVEQWEQWVELTGERYYSMAAESNTNAARRHVAALHDALQEQDPESARGGRR